MNFNMRSKQIVVLSIALSACLFVIYNQSRNYPSFALPSDKESHRRLSVALPNGGCQITWPKPPPPNTQITYAASYPGCGARMTWNLVEALTGLETGDDWNNNGRGEKVVTVKTHYPQSNGILPEFDDKINRAFLVVRNPMESIPSFFNHIYEMRNHLPVHSERAPLEEWIKWRDHYLEEEIKEYKKFHIYWMDRMAPENRYVITYEGLTDDLIGAEVTKGLNEFLGTADGVDAIDRESVPCVWRAVVKNQPPEHQKEQIKKLEKAKAGSESELGGNTRAAASQTMRVDESGDSLGSAPNVANIEMNANIPGTQAVDGKKNVLTKNSESLQRVYIDQTQQQFQGLGLQMPSAENQKMSPQMPAESQMFQQPQMVSSANVMFQQSVPVENHLQYQQSFQQFGQYPQIQQYQQPMQYPPMQMQYGPGNLRHRRLDPGHHDSQRKGPKVPRPYTAKQLELMMQMLKELGDRYSGDVRLNNIMKGYYEKVEKARLDLSASSGERNQPEAPPGGFF